MLHAVKANLDEFDPTLWSAIGLLISSPGRCDRRAAPHWERNGGSGSMNAGGQKTYAGLVRFGLLLCALVLPLFLATKQSTTGDEVAHIPAGYSYLATHEIILNPMHPPLIKELCALPLLLLQLRMPASPETIREMGRDITYQWKFGADFLAANPPIEPLVFWSRVPVALLSLALAALVMTWSTELWGPIGGLLSGFLYIFDPNVTAHAQFVTTDVGFAFFAALFIWLLRRYTIAPSPPRLLAVGVALGLALGAKFSAVLLVPIAACLFVFRAGRGDPFSRFVVAFPLMLMTALFVLWIIYFFPLDPLFYLRGLRTVEADFNPRALHFLMGDLRHGSWPWYFFVAWLIKTPLPAIAIVATAFACCAFGVRTSWREEAFVALPLVALFAGYSFLAPPLGIRYILPCYPFLYVFAGRMAVWRLARTPSLRIVFAACALWYLAEFAAIWPDHLPYFNQITGGYRGGPAWLDDSNVDWGEGLIALRDYLREEPAQDTSLCYFGNVDPALYGIESQVVWIDAVLPRPKPGRWILSSFCVSRAGVWLRQRFGDGPENWIAHTRPKAIVGHVYYVYDIVDVTSPTGKP
jgi:hypothetical protein